jgi:hypothetical protein
MIKTILKREALGTMLHFDDGDVTDTIVLSRDTRVLENLQRRHWM